MQLVRHGLQLLELTRLGDSLPTGEFLRELTILDPVHPSAPTPWHCGSTGSSLVQIQAVRIPWRRLPFFWLRSLGVSTSQNVKWFTPDLAPLKSRRIALRAALWPVEKPQLQISACCTLGMPPNAKSALAVWSLGKRSWCNSSVEHQEACGTLEPAWRSWCRWVNAGALIPMAIPMIVSDSAGWDANQIMQMRVPTGRGIAWNMMCAVTTTIPKGVLLTCTVAGPSTLQRRTTCSHAWLIQLVPFQASIPKLKFAVESCPLQLLNDSEVRLLSLLSTALDPTFASRMSSF